ARALLARDATARADEQARHEAILVDELQDTNGLQDELVELVRAPAAPLLVVGDPKQSIYEFPRAHLALFDRPAAPVAPPRPRGGAGGGGRRGGAGAAREPARPGAADPLHQPALRAGAARRRAPVRDRVRPGARRAARAPRRRRALRRGPRRRARAAPGGAP